MPQSHVVYPGTTTTNGTFRVRPLLLLLLFMSTIHTAHQPPLTAAAVRAVLNTAHQDFSEKHFAID